MKIRSASVPGRNLSTSTDPLGLSNDPHNVPSIGEAYSRASDAFKARMQSQFGDSWQSNAGLPPPSAQSATASRGRLPEGGTETPPRDFKKAASLEQRMRSIPLQIMVELPDGDADETMAAVAEGRITHQITKKRRRIPVWLTFSAFITVLYAAAVSTVSLAFSVYIFNKAKQPRAKNAVDAQTAVLLPILKNITELVTRLQPKR